MKILFKVLLVIIINLFLSQSAFALSEQLGPVFRYVDLGNGQVQIETGLIYNDGRFVSNIDPVLSTDTSIFGAGVLSAISGKIITEQAVYTGFKPIIDKKFRRSKQTYDISGGQWVIITVAGIKPIKPVITIAATDPEAAETNADETDEMHLDKGEFLISLNKTTSIDTVVKFSIFGTAKKGQDFVSFKSKLKIPAGTSSGVIKITPLEDDNMESTETVTLKLVAGTGYSLGKNKKATLQIIDND